MLYYDIYIIIIIPLFIITCMIFIIILLIQNWSAILQFIKTAKHEVPETIQYGRLLKELGKIVKTYEETMVT